MTTATSVVTRDQVHWLVEQAARAPSIHNTQPWRFTWRGGNLDVYADTTRGLTASDAEGRELVISCGAALLNLRVAARKLDAIAQVTTLPDPHDPRWLARVRFEPAAPASPDERHAYAALLRRHTHRGAFDDRPVPPQLNVRLQRAAEAEGAQLIFIADPGQRRRVLQLARAAEGQLNADDRVREELEAWTRAASDQRRDGVAATAFPADVAGESDDLPARDFDLGRGIGHVATGPQSPGAVAVLMTERDLLPDWLTAGQALEHVLITAADEWAFAALHSQLVEVENLRSELRRELTAAGHPQILLRIGYSTEAPPTRRRSAADILDITQRGLVTGTAGRAG